VGKKSKASTEGNVLFFFLTEHPSVSGVGYNFPTFTIRILADSTPAVAVVRLCSDYINNGRLYPEAFFGK